MEGINTVSQTAMAKVRAALEQLVQNDGN